MDNTKKKIIIICFIKLDELPPMLSVLKILSKKYRVVYIGVDDLNSFYEKTFEGQVEFVNLLRLKLVKDNNFRGKFNNFIFWKTYNFFLKKANKILQKYYTKGDLVWIHHEHTLMRMRRVQSNISYYLTMYELHQDLFKKKCELKFRVKKANKIIVPDYSRAAIVQACVGLNDLPYVIPNKPYDFNDEVADLQDNPVLEIVKKAHEENKLVILYSGIFLRERKLDTIIEAVEALKDRYIMVMIGRESQYLHELLNKYSNIYYLGFYNPPSHLSIIKNTDVGILTYVADSGSINPVFCAPNKIWEYSKYGIPMICNDIPGLKYTVEYNKFGYCCNINCVEEIKCKLIKIKENYESLSKNAYEYYDTIDIEKLVMEVVGE